MDTNKESNSHFSIEGNRLVTYKGSEKTITIPPCVSIIETNSFYNSNIHRVIIGNSVKEIKTSAFRCCGSLQEMVLPDSLEQIGEILDKCNQIKCIFANPNTVGEAFAIKHSILVVPHECLDSNWLITGGKLARCNNLYKKEHIAIPEGISCLGRSVFENYRHLSTLEIPSSVFRIESKAFRKCVSLRLLEIPDDVSELNGCTFEYCECLEGIRLPQSLKKIWGNCFNGCSSLKNVDIPNGCMMIAGQAFSGCKSLKSITIPSSVEFIQSNAFSNCPHDLIFLVENDSMAYYFVRSNNLMYKLV